MIQWVGICALADIGPENSLVVVNKSSRSSLTVANRYVHLRRIPSSNVLLLSNVPVRDRITVEQFQRTILGPILAEIEERRLGNQIRVIGYSSEFPLEIDISNHTRQIKDESLRRVMTPVASINGATFHFRHLHENSPGYLQTVPSNLYSRLPFGRFFANPFSGDAKEEFDAAVSLGSEGNYEASATKFLALLDRSPEHFPLAFLATRNYVRADRVDLAKRSLERAIEAGWPSALYLQADSRMEKLLEDPEISELIQDLSELPIEFQPPVGFRGDRVWAPNGIPIPTGHGVNYLLSCCLAVAGSNGMTTEQTVEQLRRSVAADYTMPDGEFLFSQTADIRTKKRAPGFSPAIKGLAFRGQRASTFPQKLPRRKVIAGLMLGTAGFDWQSSQSTLVPGAIADNLTSFGGAMSNRSQTKLTALLVAGAAMSSGTVAEPYANEWKFPHPMMQAHYAAGLTAIEAFYSSIDAPYQLLIAGEPMCKPFARRPRLALSLALDPKAPDRFMLIGRSVPGFDEATETERRRKYLQEPVKVIEVYVDGLRVGESAPIDTAAASTLVSSDRPIPLLQINLTNLPAGMRELRATVVYDNAMESRQSVVEWIGNRGSKSIPVASIIEDAPSEDALDRPATDNDRSNEVRKIATDGRKVAVSAEGADAVELRYFGRVVGRADGARAEMNVTVEDCGSGPVRVRPIAVFGNQEVPGKPIIIEL